MTSGRHVKNSNGLFGWLGGGLRKPETRWQLVRSSAVEREPEGSSEPLLHFKCFLNQHMCIHVCMKCFVLSQPEVKGGQSDITRLLNSHLDTRSKNNSAIARTIST